MICASCADPTSAAPCEACGGDPWLDGRYRLEDIVGVGASGATYRAVALTSGREVAIKELPLRRGVSAKGRELFEREARVLSELEHPRIPAYVEHFVAGSGRARALFIVQAFITGQTLDQELREHRYTQDEVLQIVGEVLGILVYLHGLSPPVIHRDLKPGNVMRDASGRLVLVDFGSVRDALTGDYGGSTVAGTFGYMAPEQFTGEATAATDLYAVGALAIALLTRRDPATLADHANRLRWHDHASVHPTVAALLDGLVAPNPAVRARDAHEALAEVQAIQKCRQRALVRRQVPEVHPEPIRRVWRHPVDIGQADTVELGPGEVPDPVDADTVEIRPRPGTVPPPPPTAPPGQVPQAAILPVPRTTAGSALMRLLARVRRSRRRMGPARPA